VRRALAVLLAAVVAAALPAVVTAAPDFDALKLQPYDAPKVAPAFTLPDPDGRATTLGDLRGKVVLLFFWSTW